MSIMPMISLCETVPLTQHAISTTLLHLQFV